MGDIFNDSRFTKYLNDPKYRQIPKHEKKVQIDKRFQSMFNDKKFKVKYTVDKRGRPVNETSTENLRKYYDLKESDDDSHSSEDEEANEGVENIKSSADFNEKSVKLESESGQFVKHPVRDDVVSSIKQDPLNDKLERGDLNKKVKTKLLDLDIDYARGEGVLMSDSSSDDESSEEEVESEVEHEWGEMDADAETTDESTRRIAVCNLDWDNIKATDIMVLLSSFLPSGGIILKVSIYPSEYGLKRMEQEEVQGPIELTGDAANDSDDGGNEEGSSYHMEKLRRYQLNRLKYYYAVVECDSLVTADKLYSECDGLEYESSATRLDMRFIPDDVTFEQEPREICMKMPDPSKYKPRLFTTTALQQAKVELTWDATNPNRADAIKDALDGNIDDLDLKDYLASSSEDEDAEQLPLDCPAAASDSEDEDPIQKYKTLLNDIESKEERKKSKDMEMEVTWGLGVKDKAEELVKKKLTEEKKDLTPFEKILEKRKEKKKEKKLKRKEKIDRERMGSSDSEGSSSADDDIPSDVDMNDSYFAEEFNKPEFKKNKTKEKSSRSQPKEQTKEDETRQAELELLLDEDNDGKAHFSLKRIQESENNNKKSRRKKLLKEKMIEHKNALPDFEINVDDERFSALYKSHLYNIDPSDPNFKKTKNMERLIREKLKRRPTEPSTDHVPGKKSKEDAELDLLVKNIKRKTKNIMKK